MIQTQFVLPRLWGLPCNLSLVAAARKSRVFLQVSNIFSQTVVVSGSDPSEVSKVLRLRLAHRSRTQRACLPKLRLKTARSRVLPLRSHGQPRSYHQLAIPITNPPYAVLTPPRPLLDLHLSTATRATEILPT